MRIIEEIEKHYLGAGMLLGLLVMSIVVCTTMSWWPGLGHHFYGCDKITRLMDKVVLGRGETGLMVGLVVAAVLGVRRVNRGDIWLAQSVWWREDKGKVMTWSMVDPVMLALRYGILHNLQYN